MKTNVEKVIGIVNSLETAAKGTIKKCKEIIKEKGIKTANGKVLKIESDNMPFFIPELKQGMVEINYAKVTEKDDKLYLSNDNENWYEPDGEIACYELMLVLQEKK